MATFRWMAWLVVWAFTNFFAFALAFAFGRVSGLFVGGDAGADLGSWGVLDVSPDGNAVLGAAVFLIIFVGVACLVQWLALLGIERQPALLWSTGWALLSFILLFLLVLHEPLELRSLPLHIAELPVFLLLSALLVRKPVRKRLAAIDRTRWITSAGWTVLALTAAAGVYLAFVKRPWLGSGNCGLCGSVPAATVGFYLTAVTGPFLMLHALLSGRRSRREPL